MQWANSVRLVLGDLVHAVVHVHDVLQRVHAAVDGAGDFLQVTGAVGGGDGVKARLPKRKTQDTPMGMAMQCQARRVGTKLHCAHSSSGVVGVPTQTCTRWAG